MSRDYAAAVAALNTLQSNFSIVDAIRKSGRGMNKQAIPEMVEWCHKIGYEPADFNILNPIHIAGTKGKGSTSAFISSVLAQYAKSPAVSNKLSKTGLYTSPHLRFVRERIQINDKPLSEESFAKYFFEIWDLLETAARRDGHPNPSDPSTKPVYFRFLTLMAFHAYMKEGVNAAVIECGIGGEYDSTNILVQPSVTGITSLGIDHTAMLGNTIEEIAWHKSGIFKSGVPAYTVQQSDAAIKVLRQRAAEKGADLHVVQRHPELDQLKLGLAADFQKTNASLAIAIAAAHLRKLGLADIPENIADSLPHEFRMGLETVRWPGRCETRREGKVVWHLDGGHTLDSIKVAGEWFASRIPSAKTGRTSKRILIFNQQTRDAAALARALHSTLVAALDDERPFTHAVFCTNTTFTETGFKPDLVSVNANASDVESLSVQRGLAETWAKIDQEAEVKVMRTIEEAVAFARKEGDATNEDEVLVLITGSLHLVGGALEVLESPVS
ncbi:hypothetical protein B0A49_04252 [Cryomyces minteri]|uniref:Folylpolyglutamate synthase n=1 Tax=Cryomyces minteri TaxID=331657 RepID=A0A4U0XBD7_9PEZI|nr:hypothetical protein B0A49_07691 [Cryomyces minteri]TKA74010.1 hypothetical protein B0A49_04252 [Cryomyces minteri]